MTKEEFLSEVQHELQLQGATFRLPELRTFVDTVWREAREDPDATRWAQQFLGSGGAGRQA